MSQVVTEWMIGWKLVLAYCADDLKTIRFVPIHQDGLVSPYGVDAVAECQQCAWHQPPESGCHCGFNAWHDRSMNDRYRLARSLAVARDTNGNGSFVELRVGLYGTVVEGTLWQGSNVGDAWGYQASQQRVSDVFFAPQCYLCGGTAVQIGLVRKSLAFGWSTRPVCQSHVGDQVSVTLELLAQSNSIDVHWKTPN